MTERIRGLVTEAGGGYVTILVARDTEHYPEPGSTVDLLIIQPGPRKRVYDNSRRGAHNDGQISTEEG